MQVEGEDGAIPPLSAEMQSAVKDITHEHAKEEPNVNAVWHLKDKVAATVAAKGEPTSGTISSSDVPGTLATHKGDTAKNKNAAEQNLLQKAAEVRARLFFFVVVIVFVVCFFCVVVFVVFVFVVILIILILITRT